MNENLKLQGQWSQPGGDKKVFTTGANSISWRKSRKDLQFKGTDAELLKHSVCSIMKDTRNIVNNMATNTEMPTCQNNSELTTDIACIKLDQVINERHIFDNTSRIKEIGNMLAKFEKKNEEIQREMHNLKEISEPLRKHVQQTTEFQYANNPAHNSHSEDFLKRNQSKVGVLEYNTTKSTSNGNPDTVILRNNLGGCENRNRTLISEIRLVINIDFTNRKCTQNVARKQGQVI